MVQVCPRFPVPVPEFFSREHPSDSSTDHAGHDSSAWQVEPDDRVGLVQMRVANQAFVVAVGNLAVSGSKEEGLQVGT